MTTPEFGSSYIPEEVKNSESLSGQGKGDEFDPVEAEELIRNYPLDEFVIRLEAICDHPSWVKEMVPLTGVVLDRFENELQRGMSAEGIQLDPSLALDLGEQTARFFWRLSLDKEAVIEHDLLERAYRMSFHENHWISFFSSEMLETLVRLDYKTEVSEEEKILAQIPEDIVTHILEIETPRDVQIAKELLDVFSFSQFFEFNEVSPQNILLQGLNRAETPEQIRRLFTLVSNCLGLEETRQFLRDQVVNNPELKERFDFLEKSLNLSGKEQGEVYTDLRKLYADLSGGEKEGFEGYEPNRELQSFEENLLFSSFQENEKVLDVGCGPELRHMFPLMEKGVSVMGLEYSPEHTRRAKKKYPEAMVIEGDWHDTPFEKGKFDHAYCLGRSFLHNTTVEQGINFLEEMSRVTQEEGDLIIDLPNLEVGHYREEKERISRRATELGLFLKEKGVIIDSPDGASFFDRLVPVPDQFKAMAKIAGWEAEIVGRQQYTEPHPDDPSQKVVNENVYWKLTKRKEPLSLDESREAYDQVYTQPQSFPIVRLV